MKVLVINSGSSSVKFQLFDMPKEKCLVKGNASKNVGGTTEFYFTGRGIKHQETWQGFDYGEIIKKLLDTLVNPDFQILRSLEEIEVVGHRLIHGAGKIEDCVKITDGLIAFMKANTPLAPLHYPPNIKGIEAVKKKLPGALQTGVFDTAFHQTMPQKAFLYGIPFNWYEEYNIRRFGFHGISHKYVSERSCELTSMYFNRSKIISCHLGNGASVTAIQNGKSMDTSMGMTPVEGLVMGTRSGDIDAGLLVYLQKNYGLSADEIGNMLNYKSGLVGLSGISSDFREVEKAASNGDKQAQIALDVYCYRVKKYIGAYLAAIGGANLLVFTGGIGENSAKAREIICRKMEWAGMSLSESLNDEMNGTEAIISESGSKVKILIVPANEELLIARESAKLAKTEL